MWGGKEHRDRWVEPEGVCSITREVADDLDGVTTECLRIEENAFGEWLFRKFNVFLNASRVPVQ